MSAAFLTEDGSVVPTVTAEQMAVVDRIAVEDTGPQLLQMMENAGRSLCLTAVDELDRSGGRDGPVVVLAGTGGNGGGGLAAARHLANRGLDVHVVITAPDRLSDAAGVQRAGLVSTPARLVGPAALDVDDPALIVDALIGYGLRAAPRGPARDLIEWTRGRAAPVVSLDVPSGIDATTGERGGVFVVAATTLTLALPKPGLVVAAAGEVVLADIGIPAATFAQVGVTVPPSLFARGFRVPLLRGPDNTSRP